MKKIDAFWDTSALAPLCVDQGASPAARAALARRSVTVWWSTPVEMKSAFCRLRRDGEITSPGFAAALARLARLEDSWIVILPGARIRAGADLLLEKHPLRAADALQLAAALVWSGDRPGGAPFICLDRRLAEAARQEGFAAEMGTGQDSGF